MKACKYCGSYCEDSALSCSSCGASEFSHICENCGEIFSTSYCPNCGVKAGTKGTTCPRCGKRYFTPFCPGCGYSVLDNYNRQAASQQVIVQREYVPVENASGRKKAGVWGVLLAIFFPYVAIFPSTFGKLYESKRTRIGIAIWNAIIAFSTMMTGLEAGDETTVSLVIFGLIMTGVSIISIIKIVKEKD